MSSPVYINRQWAVTPEGMTTVRPGAPYEYNIGAGSLLNAYNGPDDIYDWPYHLAGKNWTDIEAFVDAFGRAIEHHHAGQYDAERLDRSFKAARDRAGRP